MKHPSDFNATLVLAPLMLGALAYGVLGTIVVPALPLFEHDLHTNEIGATWLLTSYFLAAAAATAILGRLGDMFGKRRMLLITLMILAVGTLVSAVSSTLPLEIVGRVLQGVAGGLFPLAFGIIRDEFPHERVPHGIAAVATMISLGAFGVVLPGLIVPHLSWHWLFWIPMILTLLALLGTWKFVRESPVRPGGSVNWINAALMTTGITAAVLGISQSSTWGWSSLRTWGLIVGGVAVCALWVLAEVRSSAPLINMSLMRLRVVWTSNVVSFMMGAAMYSAFAVYPIFAQLPQSTGFGFGASMLRCGLYLVPMPVASAIISPLAGGLAKKVGTISVMILGCVIMAAGFGYMALWHGHPYDMVVSLAVMGAGLGFAFPTLLSVVVHAVPARNVGETTGMNTVLRMIGGAVGTQVVSSLITSHHRNGLPALDGFTASYTALAAFALIAGLTGLIVTARPKAGTAGHDVKPPVPVTV